MANMVSQVFIALFWLLIIDYLHCPDKGDGKSSEVFHAMESLVVRLSLYFRLSYQALFLNLCVTGILAF